MEILAEIGGCLHGVTITHGLFISLFLAGLVGGYTHCMAMCGPFVLSQAGDLKKIQDAALVPYHLGRITTYTGMAIALSSVLNLAFLFMPVRSYVVAPVLLLAGVVFLVSAFPVLKSLFPWIDFIRFGVPAQWLQDGLNKLQALSFPVRTYLMGVLLGFVPCGLIVSALMAASTAPDALHAGMAMGSFGLGTMPALIMTSVGGRALKNKYPHILQPLTQGFMVWSAIWLFALAGLMMI